MFWHAKSPLDHDDEEWQIESWKWLLANNGGLENFRALPLILPTSEFFAPTGKIGHDKAHHIFNAVAGHLAVEPEAFDLVSQEERINPLLDTLMVVQNAPGAPAGTFQADESNRMQITYDPQQTDAPATLIATLAHEICHPILFSYSTLPPGGEGNIEFATDLAVALFRLRDFCCKLRFRVFTVFRHGDWSTGLVHPKTGVSDRSGMGIRTGALLVTWRSSRRIRLALSQAGPQGLPDQEPELSSAE